MIASRIPTILPELDLEQALEVTAVHSISGGLGDRSPMSRLAPIISPHHTASRVAIVGGGSHIIKPGACSLAHHGVLFIDEAPECAVGVLDSLRQPLESGNITITRSVGNITFPAHFLLVIPAHAANSSVKVAPAPAHQFKCDAILANSLVRSWIELICASS
jgi:magnesium chelatase family protein